MRRYLFTLFALGAWVVMSVQAQDMHRVPTEPITAQIAADSSTIAHDSIASDSLKTTIWDAMPFVHIHQPTYIRVLAEGGQVKVTQTTVSGGGTIIKQKMKRDVRPNPMGYRLEIYQSNDQRQGRAEADRIKAALTGKVTVPIYVRFISPFWRVRIGDFRTLEEANNYKRSFIQRFPAMKGQTYPVRENIKGVVTVRTKE